MPVKTTLTASRSAGHEDIELQLSPARVSNTLPLPAVLGARAPRAHATSDRCVLCALMRRFVGVVYVATFLLSSGLIARYTEETSTSLAPSRASTSAVEESADVPRLPSVCWRFFLSTVLSRKVDVRTLTVLVDHQLYPGPSDSMLEPPVRVTVS